MKQHRNESRTEYFGPSEEPTHRVRFDSDDGAIEAVALFDPRSETWLSLDFSEELPEKLETWLIDQITGLLLREQEEARTGPIDPTDYDSPEDL